MVKKEIELDDLNYQLYLLHTICKTLQRTLDVDKIIHVILTGLTAGGALSFSRAAIFFFEKEENCLKNGTGIGPYDSTEAGEIWAELGKTGMSLEDLFENGHRIQLGKQIFPQKIKKIILKLDQIPQNNPINIVLKEGRVYILKSEEKHLLPSELLEVFQYGSEIIFAPLFIKEEVSGLVIVDNAFHYRQIEKTTIDFLSLIIIQAGLALGNAFAYQETKKNLEKMEELNETLKKIQEEMSKQEQLVAIGRFSTYLAHEIRNPLVTIAGFTKQILGTNDLAKIYRNCTIINDEVERLEARLKNLMRFSFIPKPQKEEFLVYQVANELKQLMEISFQTRGITFEQEIPEDFKIYGDKVLLREVFFNLINNSLDFVEKGGWIKIKGFEEQGYCCVEVCDNGCGISKENLEKIFTPFFTTKSQGVGLGLSVVKIIVEKTHNGKVEVFSELGKGTTVKISIPKKGEE